MRAIITPVPRPTEESMARLNDQGLAIRAEMDRRHAEASAQWKALGYESAESITRYEWGYSEVAGCIAVIRTREVQS